MKVWAVAKVYEVLSKVHTEDIINRKSCVEIRTNSIGGADVLGPTRAVKAQGGDEVVGVGGICTRAGAGATGTRL